MIGPYPSEADVRRVYERRYAKLKRVARALQREIELQVDGDKDVVLVQARAKGVEEFVSKSQRPKGWPDARKPRSDSDPKLVRKYAYPMEDIQDQVGCRVVVKSPRTRTAVALLLAQHYGHLERGYKVDSNPSTFGYAAHHVICQIPPVLRNRWHVDTEVFEIQVVTLFQFAWSQMDHAAGYKPGKALTREQRRNLAAAAALAETADLLFSRVREIP